MFNQVSAYLTQNNLLDSNQSGFRSGHSTEMIMLSVVEALKTCNSILQVFTYLAGSVHCFWYGQPPDPPVNPIEKGHLKNLTPVVQAGHCNAFLAGLPASSIKPLQLIQNAATRLIFNEPKRTHVTPLFINLHWLPIAARIKFKASMSINYPARLPVSGKYK